MEPCRFVVEIASQSGHLMKGNERLRTFPVSTATNGTGVEVGSNKTPTGKLRIAAKIGEGCATGTVFRGRKPTGEVWSPNLENPLSQSSDDLILTRILWLEGCDPENSNTLERFIYIHGTNQEHLLGSPASCGCIRMSNRDVVEVFEKLPFGAIVEVLET